MSDYSRSGASRHNRARLEGMISVGAVICDLLMILSGFLLAFWVRYESGLFTPRPNSVPVVISDYWRLILFGTAAVFWGLLGKGSYGYKDMLTPGKTLWKFLTILTVCLFAFIGISLTVRTSPPISRAFVVFAWVFIFMTVYSWRILLSRILRHPAITARLRKRLLVVGAGAETLQIMQQISRNPEMEFVGWIQGNKPNRAADLEASRLGSLHEMEKIVQRNAIDVVVLTESDALQREAVMFVAKVCERELVEFKLVPHFFEILISGLRPSVVGGISLMGVDSLPLNAYQNRIVKRTFDILGACVGMVFSLPLIAFFGTLVYLESPGPILYRQVRTGRNGRSFHIFKIRSMKMDAEGSGKAKWCQENDPRRLRIGAFMRKWNIDEIPQFWNVLKGDMSLVGPRPERPELIDRFKYKIPYYQTRHLCRPGLSGWAQVNGWRGNTSLEKRISYDIWYVENWTIFLDFRIMFLTFCKQQNAY